MSNESTQPYGIDIVRPDLPTLHVGPFEREFSRDDWASTLRMQMHSTAHVDGTTIEPVPFNPDTTDPSFVIDPYALPSDSYKLADLMRDDKGGDGTGRDFPDLYARLRCQYGERRAGWLHQQASMILDEEAECDRHRQDNIEAAATIIACMTEAEKQFMQALVALNRATERVWGIDGEFDGQDVGDLTYESDTAMRSIRNIIRNMRDFQTRTAKQQERHDQQRRSGTAS